MKDFVPIYSLGLLLELRHPDDANSSLGETFCLLLLQDAEVATLHGNSRESDVVFARLSTIVSHCVVEIEFLVGILPASVPSTTSQSIELCLPHFISIIDAATLTQTASVTLLLFSHAVEMTMLALLSDIPPDFEEHGSGNQQSQWCHYFCTLLPLSTHSF